jgi:hypothetical protein
MSNFCEYREGTVQPLPVKHEAFKHKDGFVILEDVTIGVCRSRKTSVRTNCQTLRNISWQEINGMRNRLVHQYDDVNLNIVWDVVQTEIPTLIEELKLRIPPES